MYPFTSRFARFALDPLAARRQKTRLRRQAVGFIGKISFLIPFGAPQRSFFALFDARALLYTPLFAFFRSQTRKTNFYVLFFV